MAKGSKAQRRAQSAAAERAAALRKEAERKERRKRSAMIAAVAVVVLVAVGGLAALVVSNRDAGGGAATAPAGAVAMTAGPEKADAGRYAVPWGRANAPVKVVVYEDFLCPFCRNFEEASSPVLTSYVENGDVEVQYRALNFLSRVGPYSELAANAYAVVLDADGPDVAKAFHDALFENQPSESGPFPDEENLVDLAVSAGATRDAVEKGIGDGEFEDWVADATKAAADEGVSGTPTVYVDGVKIEPSSEADLLAQLQAKIDSGLKG